MVAPRYRLSLQSDEVEAGPKCPEMMKVVQKSQLLIPPIFSLPNPHSSFTSPGSTEKEIVPPTYPKSTEKKFI